MKEDLLYKIALVKVPGIGSVNARNLLSYCGSAQEVFKAKKRDLLRIPGIGQHTATQIRQSTYLEAAEKELSFISQHNIQVLFCTDKAFPQRLRQQHDCPFLLFSRGNVDLNHHRIVGIIGTRAATSAGRALCEEIIEGLTPYDVAVVSGLAYGIDIIAHRKCLSSAVPTIGVMGSGMGSIYPSEHAAVARKMCENGGAVLTEYCSDTTARAEHFPMRNRIVAGMCDALIVVETARKGGSMITAELAFGYNRDVFALPGRVKDRFSEGCNLLIKTDKARLIENATDVAYFMRWDEPSGGRTIQQQLFAILEPDEKNLLEILQSAESMAIDEIARVSRCTPGALATLLLSLEFKGAVCALPGKRYMAVS